MQLAEQLALCAACRRLDQRTEYIWDGLQTVVLDLGVVYFKTVFKTRFTKKRSIPKKSLMH